MKERHYFTDNSDLPSHPKEVLCSMGKRTWTFVTDDGVFSKSEVDRGTMVLLKALIYEDLKGKVLDLGCGYGVIAVVLKSVFPDIEAIASDVNPRALELAEKNAAKNGAAVRLISSDGFAAIEETFDVIVTNPPIRTGKAVIYAMFEDAYKHLSEGGRFYAVIRRKQGAESAMDKLAEVFGSCDLIDRGKGYWVLRCVK
jgi:16S rRNA (guanine1207-N2)-methyltransferase